MGPVGRTTIAVAVCTYNRNGPLAVLLEAARVNAVRLGDRAAVGVVVVDDSAAGNARHVAERFKDCFELGLLYRISGRQNISRARNLALETAIGLADWTAMTDDDCEPVPEWLEALLDVQRRTGADAICGRMIRRPPPGAPAWLTNEPFLDIALMDQRDGAPLDVAATHNSMISNRWLASHPAIRFDPAFGVIGGEDMVFYRTARAAGLRIHFAERAVVHENEPPSRATLAYQLRVFFWLGNQSYITCVHCGERPFRLFLHGANSLRQAVSRPIVAVCRGRRPQLRYSLALMLRALGVMLSPLGLRMPHR
jgi:hypothetical protein